MMHIRSTSAGFTLIEALVAITVLLLAIVGPMTIAQNGIQNSIFARDQIVAFYIAQEGVELIRSIRDDNALNNRPWLTGIPLSGGGANCASAEGCGIDVENMNFIDCAGNGGAACNIFYDEDGLTPGSQRGIYGHDSNSDQTVYARSIHITTINANEISVDATVTWLSRGGSRTITVQSRLLDQYDNL
jgi:type II secretory pathway pseudopilin PulG